MTINDMQEDRSNSSQDSATESLAEVLRSPAPAKLNKVTPVLVQDARKIAASVLQTGDKTLNAHSQGVDGHGPRERWLGHAATRRVP